MITDKPEKQNSKLLQEVENVDVTENIHTEDYNVDIDAGELPINPLSRKNPAELHQTTNNEELVLSNGYPNRCVVSPIYLSCKFNVEFFVT